MSTGIGRPAPEGNGKRTVLAVRLPDGQRVQITAHCVDRFWQRAASGCTTFKAAKARLKVLLTQFGVFTEPPDWAGWVNGSYIAVGDDIGLIYNFERAQTCITRGSIGDERRALRNKGRRRRPKTMGRLKSDRPHASFKVEEYE